MRCCEGAYDAYLTTDSCLSVNHRVMMYKGTEFREHERSVRVARSAAQRYSVFFNGIIAWLFIIFTYLLFMVRASNCVLIKTSIVPSSYPPVAHDQESAYIPNS